MLEVNSGDASFYLERTDLRDWTLEFNILDHLCHPMYIEDGKDKKFQNGTDIALAVVEVSDPIRLGAAFGDIRANLS